MKKTFFLLLSFLIFNLLQSQINVTASTDATLLAQQLAGQGVVITNAVINCPNNFSGTFSNAPNGLGISDGIVLATGSVLDIPNDPTIFANTGDNNNSDADLDGLLTSLGEPYTTNDACALEFDITVIGDTLKFNYIMGSEEYPDFVCGGVNDIFGFFISGPNPTGGNYVNQNVALIPNTNIPVSINTVNNGIGIFGGTAITCYNATYNNFFNGTVPGIVYDGNTVTLEAKALTVACGSYHFKLAVGDGGDNIYDSGVFLEQGSFSSTGVTVASGTVFGAGFNTLVEGCVDGEITFTLADGVNNTNLPIEIFYSYTGSATFNVDYAPIPQGQLFIQPGDSSVTVSIITVPDNIDEGIETIEINIVTGCGSIIASSIDIADVIPISANKFADSICFGESSHIELSGAQTFTWTNNLSTVSNPNSGIVDLTPNALTSYNVNYTLGSCSDDTTIVVSISNLEANLTSQDISCFGINDGSISVNASNYIGSPLVYNWTDGNTNANRNNLGAGIYCVEVTDGICVVPNLCVTLSETQNTVAISTDNAILCNESITSLNVTTSMDTATSNFIWSPSLNIVDTDAKLQTETKGINQTTTFNVSVTDANGCVITDAITITYRELIVNPNYTDTTVVSGNTIDIGLNIESQLNLTDSITHEWTPIEYLASTSSLNTTTTPTDNITYTIHSFANECNDYDTINVFIDVDIEFPNAFTPNGDGLNDVFYPIIGGGNVTVFRIYNRWGDLVHDDKDNGWDGKFKEKIQKVEVYNYYMEASNGKEIIKQSGTFTLLK